MIRSYGLDFGIAESSMRNDSVGLIMSELWDATAIDNLEDTSFDFHGSISRMVE